MCINLQITRIMKDMFNGISFFAVKDENNI